MPLEDLGRAEPAITLDSAEEETAAEVARLCDLYVTVAFIAFLRATDPHELHELLDALLDGLLSAGGGPEEKAGNTGGGSELRKQEPAPSCLGQEGATSVLTASHE